MKQPSANSKRFRKRLALCLLALVLLSAIASAVYLSSYYPASESAMRELETNEDSVTIRISKDRIDFIPDEPTAGIIFYPGGKVQFEAYVPLLKALAEKNILCVMPKMPGNLAVLDMDAAEGIREVYPQIQDWYLAGHSLGGAVAAEYLFDHSAGYRGLILLAAYSDKDLTDTSLRVLTIYGSEDCVLNREKLERCRSNLPEDSAEIEIEGGCHAYFGSYGAQDGDGIPAISREEQISKTVQYISDWIS